MVKINFFPTYEDAWSSISMDLKKVLLCKNHFFFHLGTQFTCTSHAHEMWTQEWSLWSLFPYGRMVLHLSFHWNQRLSSTERGTIEPHTFQSFQIPLTAKKRTFPDNPSKQLAPTTYLTVLAKEGYSQACII